MILINNDKNENWRSQNKALRDVFFVVCKNIDQRHGRLISCYIKSLSVSFFFFLFFVCSEIMTLGTKQI